MEVIAAETGSVVIKNNPKAKPPNTKCQYHGTANIGLVAEPIQLNKELMASIPKNTAKTVRQEEMPESNNKTPPSIIAKVLVSPIEPGTKPTKAFIHEMPAFSIAATPPDAAKANGVACVKPSTATQTASPEICAG